MGSSMVYLPAAATHVSVPDMRGGSMIRCSSRLGFRDNAQDRTAADLVTVLDTGVNSIGPLDPAESGAALADK